MKLLIKVLLLVLAVSTIAATGVTRHTRHRSHLQKLTKRGVLCMAWKPAKGMAQGLLVEGCKKLGNLAKDKIAGLCSKLRVGQDLCKAAVNSLGDAAIKQGCPFIATKIVEYISSKCRRYLRLYLR